ncbi:MAG: SDR family oxidoreductase [Rhodopirellula sp.]|nr:SDR family oxidoreductase [Rhodopirellula sp.]
MLTIDLSGSVALVTGGSRGIGAGIVEAFARAGATVVLTHTGNPRYADRLGAMLGELRDKGCHVEAAVADACSPDAADRLVRQIVDSHGRLDVMVANVGQNLARPAEETTAESWRHFIDVNLSSAFHAVRAALPAMLGAGRGRILFIGSSVVFDGGGGAIDYAAAKAGMVGMMRYLTRNYARRGINSNVIHPAVIETDLLDERYGNPQDKQKLVDRVPVGRLGQPADIGNLAAYLASSHGDFICGQEILVDGGRTFY